MTTTTATKRFGRGDAVTIAGEAYAVVQRTRTGYLLETLHEHIRFDLTFDQAEEAGIKSAP